MTDPLKAIETEQRLVGYEGPDKVISSYDMLHKVVNQVGSEIVIHSGLPTLDETLGGFEAGELTVISGPTGNGKTLFAQTLTYNFTFSGHHSLWFSYEVTPKNFLKAFGESLPLFYLPETLKMNALDWLEERVYEAKLKYNCRAVFIDHLHFLVDMRTKNNMSLEIGHTMRSIKKLALKYNLCFFLIAHTSKTKMDDEIGLDSIRDSSFIGQEADNVLMVWRKPEADREANLKVVKNRKNGIFRKIDIVKNANGFLIEADDYARIAESNNYARE